MALSAFRSTTRRDFQQENRRGSSYSTDSGSVLDSTSNYQDASSQRDSDQESLEPGAYIRHQASDSESEASSIIDRFRLTDNSRNAASVPRFQQSTASARGRQRSIEPGSESRGPDRRRRSESQEPGLRRQSSDFSSRSRRSESQEPGLRRQNLDQGGIGQNLPRSGSDSRVSGRIDPREAAPIRQGRSQSKEPSIGRTRSESIEPVNRRSSSREPNRGRDQVLGLDQSDEDLLGDRRGRSSQRASIAFTPRSTSQEPRRSYSREPAGRNRSESQGPGSRDVQTEERTIRAVHAQLKQTDPPAGDVANDEASLLGVMREEVRKAVADLKAEIEQSLEKDVLTLVATKGDTSEPDIRQKYAEKLEESEIRTKELLAQLAKEEEKRVELAKIVKDLPSKPKPEQPKRKPRRSEERASISQALDEEAQRYFEEFASISTSEAEESLDGRRSRPGKRSSAAQSSRNVKKSPSRKQAPAAAAAEEEFPLWKTGGGGAVALNTDGVVTPWLDWETDSADATSSVVVAEFNWDLVDATSGLGDLDSVRVSEDLALQRIRFMERLGQGRIHLCRTEF